MKSVCPVVLHADVRPPRPMRPGRIARRDSEYKRAGTANDYLVEIASHYPRARTIHLVMDNLSSHSRKALTDSFGEQVGGWIWNRFTPHYTPKHASWPNHAKIEIGLLSRQCLGHRRIPTLNHLQREADAWNENMNRHRVPIDWRFTRAKACRKFRCKKNRFTRSRY